MKICIDIDGTICETRKPNQAYSEVKPLPGAIDKIRKLKKEGHTIILYTARNMKTCNYNVGKVLANVGLETMMWLEKNLVPYDEIHFGKPLADVYIDDKGLTYRGDWNSTEEQIQIINKEDRKWI